MSNLAAFLIADHLDRVRRERRCSAVHPMANETCVLRHGHVSPHKTDASKRWTA